MSISLNAEQTATRQKWLQTLKVGDPLVVFFNWSEKNGRIDAVVVHHDHGWISVVSRTQKDTPSNRIKYCEVSGQNPHGYGDLLPPDMVVTQEESDAIRADFVRRDRAARPSESREMSNYIKQEAETTDADQAIQAHLRHACEHKIALYVDAAIGVGTDPAEADAWAYEAGKEAWEFDLQTPEKLASHPALSAAFKRGFDCVERQYRTQRDMLNVQQMEQREALADAEFAQYQFGDGVTVSESDNWDKSDVADFTKIVYITCADDAPDADSERVSFHVRFNSDGTVDDAYGLLMRSGADIGTRPGNQAELDAMAETWSS